MRLQARACAKLNLGLKILRRRADGFHDLRTVFQTIALADRIEMEIGRGDGIELETTGLEAPAGEANLAFRAARLALPALSIRGRVRIRLHKRIPAGAGLGGGSSDAAAVLRLLALRAERPPSAASLLALAAELGSDVAPFLIGGTVLGLGRGTEVYALPDLGRWHCVLALPKGAAGAISTAEAFARWDREQAGPGKKGLTGDSDSDTIRTFCSLVYQVLPAFRTVSRNRGASRPQVERRSPKVQAGIENDFQPGVFSLSPDFPRIHQQFQRSQASWIGLSGSGAVQFGLYAEADAAERAAARLQLRYHCWQTRLVGRREYERGLAVVGE